MDYHRFNNRVSEAMDAIVAAAKVGSALFVLIAAVAIIAIAVDSGSVQKIKRLESRLTALEKLQHVEAKP